MNHSRCEEFRNLKRLLSTLANILLDIAYFFRSLTQPHSNCITLNNTKLKFCYFIVHTLKTQAFQSRLAR